MLHLKNARDFAQVLHKGRKFHGRTITVFLKTRADKEENETRIGIIVSKKAAGKAVKRNYIKRLIYHFYQTNIGITCRAYDIVVRISREVRDDTKKSLSKEIREELILLMEKAAKEK